ncbi:hypothetical protein KIK06_26460 [Nocardiopsis sp. EMB25]|uniref:hypothetical protein n=1 Tax=Nocardiopsis sp. EMB25 TaxID=2835867 RepID=UPI002284C241|nr:hypothetical protein [Nocardiopsis sp. EMB25]MCY9787429.1 hypothetical protein [Nocardiopsis sp. EMB25]
MGITSDGEKSPVAVSSGKGDLAQVTRTADTNERPGVTALITACEASQRPGAEGAVLLHTVQDVYLDRSITLPRTSWAADDGRRLKAGQTRWWSRRGNGCAA